MKITTCIAEAVKCAKAGLPVLLLGSPGLGKTSVGVELARIFGLPYFEIRCAEFESVDFRGLCVPDVEKRITTWLRPDFWPSEACVLNFDEITQAPAELTSPLLKIFLGGSIGDYHLPPGTILMATGNLVSDRAGCSRITSALRERCVVLNVEADADEWLGWYDEQPDRHDSVFSFVQNNPSMVHKWDNKADFNQPTPRNWSRLGKLLPFEPDTETVAGIIGPEVAPVFMAHHRTVSQIGTTLDFISGAKPLPKSPASLVAAVQQMAKDLAANHGTNYTAEQSSAVRDLIDNLPGTMQIAFLKAIAKAGAVKILAGSEWRAIVSRHASTINQAAK